VANDAQAVRKKLIRQGYRVDDPTGRGRCYYTVTDPANGLFVARFPISPSAGSWRRNLDAAIKRYERTGTPARSSRLPLRQLGTAPA